MRILTIHCGYSQPGGEDISTHQEVLLLRSHKHEVFTIDISNSNILDRGLVRTAGALLFAAWNRASYTHVRNCIHEIKPDIVHIHNFWFALSPSILRAAYDEAVPVIMTLHNYRLLCSNAFLYYKDKICEKCLGKSTWLSIPNACYRNSVFQTSAVVLMNEINRYIHTWEKYVDIFITNSEFKRSKYIQGGFHDEKLYTVPNYLVEDPGYSKYEGTGGVFIGRLSSEKGVHILLDAWRNIQSETLMIIGDGPERQTFKNNASELPNVTFIGHLEHADTVNKIKHARFLIMPSLWYETFGRAIIESYACGKPVIVSRLGSMAELVRNGITGLLFEPGSADDLAAKIIYLLENHKKCRAMGIEARKEYEEKYTGKNAYNLLMNIYGGVLKRIQL